MTKTIATCVECEYSDVWPVGEVSKDTSMEHARETGHRVESERYE
jgi:hypothetical protein